MTEHRPGWKTELLGDVATAWIWVRDLIWLHGSAVFDWVKMPLKQQEQNRYSFISTVFFTSSFPKRVSQTSSDSFSSAQQKISSWIRKKGRWKNFFWLVKIFLDRFWRKKEFLNLNKRGRQLWLSFCFSFCHSVFATEWGQPRARVRKPGSSFDPSNPTFKKALGRTKPAMRTPQSTWSLRLF